MDSSKKTSFPEQPDRDADIGLLLYKSGKAVKQFILWIRDGIFSLGRGIMLLLLFLMRNILWLALGTVAGTAYGIYLMKQNGANYYAEMVVKANFDSKRSLYNTLDYLNSLISLQKTDELTALLHISPEESRQLVYFSGEPVRSETITSEMYKEQFMPYGHSIKLRQDTFWMKTVKYNDFKQSLTKYDYPYHTISLVSTNPEIFRKIQAGIIERASDNELFRRLRASQDSSNAGAEKLIAASIGGIDTLRRAYNERLAKGLPASLPAGNEINISGKSAEPKTPELDLYDKVLELQDELAKARQRAVTEKDIIEVYSPFNAVGRKMSLLRQSITRYALIGLCLSVIVLTLISIYRSLIVFEKTIVARRTKQDPPKGMNT